MYDHSKVVALQIVAGNMLDVYAVEKPPENPQNNPPRFTRMPSETELTRVVCSCSSPARLRERRWYGTSAARRLRCQRRQRRPWLRGIESPRAGFSRSAPRGRTRRTRSRGDAPERPSGHGARVILRGHTSRSAPTSRAKRASGRESRHVRRTPVHGQGGLLRRRSGSPTAPRRHLAGPAPVGGGARRSSFENAAPHGLPARCRRRAGVRAKCAVGAGRERPGGHRRVRQSPVHVQGGPGCSWPAPPPARAPRAQRRAVPASPTQRQFPLPPVQEQGPSSSALSSLPPLS